MSARALHAGLLACVALAACRKPVPRERRYGFEKDGPGGAPAGFTFARTGEGRAGVWTVRRVPDAPEGQAVLAQTDNDPSKHRWLVAIANAPPLADVSVAVRCKPISGVLDQACGLVLRYRNERDYYLARADALDGNVRMYAVKDGKRTQFASFTGHVERGAWHQLRVDVRGDRFVVFLDGHAVVDAHDATIAGPGRTGLWVKSDSLTYFDDLVVRTIGAGEPFPLP
jgi:hypothetical protein